MFIKKFSHLTFIFDFDGTLVHSNQNKKDQFISLCSNQIEIEYMKTLIEKPELTRKEIFLFVLIVWIIQLIWSKYWLDKFKYGPLEFIWRKATYFK